MNSEALLGDDILTLASIATREIAAGYHEDQDMVISILTKCDALPDGAVMVSFPGTKDIVDLKTLKDDTYHFEAKRLWKKNKIRTNIYHASQHPELGRKPLLCVVGHSLGGVLAEIVANTLSQEKFWYLGFGKVSCMTFGAPKHRYKKFKNAFRFVGRGDLVPFLPFGVDKQTDIPRIFLGKKHVLVKPLGFISLMVALLQFRFLKAHLIKAYEKAFKELEDDG